MRLHALATDSEVNLRSDCNAVLDQYAQELATLGLLSRIKSCRYDDQRREILLEHSEALESASRELRRAVDERIQIVLPYDPVALELLRG